MLIPAFLRYRERHRLLPPGSRVIAAVSGGADSMCLLHLLLETRERLACTLEVAHFNHRLRGRESERDAAFVAQAARRLNLVYHAGAARALTPAERRRRSCQELAREARLGFLLALARSRRAVVALGHHADDQAETLLMRFLAGAGPAALGGIPPSSHGGALAHPLLALRRTEIEAWLAKRGIRFRSDRTNRSLRYLRNRVRLRLLPELVRDFNPRLVERLGTLAGLLRRDSEALEELARAALDRAAAVPDGLRFTAAQLEATHPAVLARAVLAALRRLAPRNQDFSSRHLEAVLARGSGARRWDLPGGIVAARSPHGLALVRPGRRKAPPPLGETALPVPGSAALPGTAGFITARIRRRPAGFDPRRGAGDERRATLDFDAVVLPLVVRGRRPGDRFRPLGTGGEKKLKEFLIDGKVPAESRDRIPLVCDRDGIIWVSGIRPGERCRVTERTRRLLCLEWLPAAPDERPRRSSNRPAKSPSTLPADQWQRPGFPRSSTGARSS